MSTHADIREGQMWSQAEYLWLFKPHGHQKAVGSEEGEGKGAIKGPMPSHFTASLISLN